MKARLIIALPSAEIQWEYNRKYDGKLAHLARLWANVCPLSTDDIMSSKGELSKELLNVPCAHK